MNFEYVNDRESELINEAIKAMTRCVKNKDMSTVLILCKLCKAIAGPRFDVELTCDYKEQRS